MTLTVPPGPAPRPGARDLRPPDRRAASGRGRAGPPPRRHGPGPFRLRSAGRRAGRQPRLRGAQGADHGIGRDGRGRDDLAARAARGVRNYDYRYAWIRDQCYAGIAMAAPASPRSARGAVRFITERVLADGPDLHPAYTASGGPSRRAPPAAARLSGRLGTDRQPGSAAVPARHLGEVLLLLAAAAARASRRGRLRAAEVPRAPSSSAGHEPEAGIWELHDDRWTHSRLCCVAGLRAVPPRRAARCRAWRARRAFGTRLAARWSSLADAIMADMGRAVASDRPLEPRRRRRSRRRGPAALGDARCAAARDPRSVATVAPSPPNSPTTASSIASGTTTGRSHEAEGAFLLCGFWMALTAHVPRRRRRGCALVRAEPRRVRPGRPYTEEYDVHQRQLRGNLPQAFVHAACSSAPSGCPATRELGVYLTRPLLGTTAG